MARVAARAASVFTDENAAPAALHRNAGTAALPRTRAALSAISGDAINRTAPKLAGADGTGKPIVSDVVKPVARPVAMSTLMNNTTGGTAATAGSHNTYHSTLSQRASVAGAAATAAAAAAAANAALAGAPAGPVTAAALAATRAGAPQLLAGVPPIRRTGSFSASLTGATAAVAAATGPALARQPTAPTGFSFAATAANNLQRAAQASSAAAVALAMPPPAPRVAMAANSAALNGAVAAAAAAATVAGSASTHSSSHSHSNAVQRNNSGDNDDDDVKDEQMGNTSVVGMEDDAEAVNRSLSGLSLDSGSSDAAAGAAGAGAGADTSASGASGQAQGTVIVADVEDKSDPLMVTDYIESIVAHLKNREVKYAVRADYMSRQTDLNPKMREILVDWLVEVHLQLHMQSETLFLAVNYIDRFLCRRMVHRNKLQLIGCTAMLIAAKYEEMYPPNIDKFVVTSAKAYDRKEFLAMEQVMLSMLDFNLTVATAYRFAQRFARVARLSRTATALVHYLVELTLQEYKFLKHLPSHIAAAAVFIASHLVATHCGQPTGADAIWNAELIAASGYKLDDISKCLKDLHALHASEPTKFLGVRKKWAAEQNRKVSTYPPVALPL